MSSDDLLLPLRPPYGLPDANDDCDRTMSSHIETGFKMKPFVSNLVLYLNYDKNGNITDLL